MTELIPANLLDRAGIVKLNPMQVVAITQIRGGSDILIVAPTGSGKTEAALLPVLESLRSTNESGIQVLYVTPLRALNRDMVARVQRLVGSTKLCSASCSNAARLQVGITTLMMGEVVTVPIGLLDPG